jgi:hypothetical protein
VDFSPYHRFIGCSALEKTVDGLFEVGQVPTELYAAHQRYHYSILHKLRSARYHIDSLSGFLTSQAALTQSPHDLVYRVNFHFDGFLHAVGSASDIFAREILTYFAAPLPAKVYFSTARTLITALRPGDAILPYLADPSWRQEFLDYRNAATHETLVGIIYTVAYELHGATSTTRIVFPIPDNPRAIVSAYGNNPDIVKYCETTFRRVLTQLNQAYTHLRPRLRTSGVLPL